MEGLGTEPVVASGQHVGSFLHARRIDVERSDVLRPFSDVCVFCRSYVSAPGDFCWHQALVPGD